MTPIVICSTSFITLGRTQLKALGAPDTPIAVIPHPFGLRTRERSACDRGKVRGRDRPPRAGRCRRNAARIRSSFERRACATDRGPRRLRGIQRVLRRSTLERRFAARAAHPGARRAHAERTRSIVRTMSSRLSRRVLARRQSKRSRSMRSWQAVVQNICPSHRGRSSGN